MSTPAFFQIEEMQRLSRIENDIRTDFANRYNVLTKDQEGVSELLDHLNSDFSFYLASFMRNPGKVEADSLRDYILREAEALAINELQTSAAYSSYDVAGIVGR